MNALHKQRLLYISIIVIVVSVALGLILYALQQNINAFLTPTAAVKNKISTQHTFRLGGMVKNHSLFQDALEHTFVITDFQHDIPVHFHGILPDLFREGAGVVVEGHLDAQQRFQASQVLAKHDEKYIPRNVQQQLARSKIHA